MLRGNPAAVVLAAALLGTSGGKGLASGRGVGGAGGSMGGGWAGGCNTGGGEVGLTLDELAALMMRRGLGMPQLAPQGGGVAGLVHRQGLQLGNQMAAGEAAAGALASAVKAEVLSICRPSLSSSDACVLTSGTDPEGSLVDALCAILEASPGQS
jgi:hypothetical protein